LDLLPGESSQPPLRLLERRQRTAAAPTRSMGLSRAWDRLRSALRRTLID
jgi:hypothetical protein